MDRIVIDPKQAIADKDSVQDYVDVLNGIMLFCRNNGYREGYRNEIAVNLTVASHMLGMDAHEVLMMFMDNGLITNKMDDEQPSDRVERVLLYCDRFDWDYMIDEGYYYNLGHGMEDVKDEELEDIPFMFVVERFE